MAGAQTSLRTYEAISERFLEEYSGRGWPDHSCVLEKESRTRKAESGHRITETADYPWRAG
jgi:hypothetical protein